LISGKGFFMAISPVGGVIYANQQMAGIAGEVGAVQNRFELQALEAQALALPAIVAELGGVKPVKIITRAPKLVNIVIPN